MLWILICNDFIAFGKTQRWGRKIGNLKNLTFYLLGRIGCLVKIRKYFLRDDGIWLNFWQFYYKNLNFKERNLDFFFNFLFSFLEQEVNIFNDFITIICVLFRRENLKILQFFSEQCSLNLIFLEFYYKNLHLVEVKNLKISRSFSEQKVLSLQFS